MRVFRWTREFHVHKESSLVPIWVALPALPIHYFDKHSLFSILSPVGRPLFLDAATAADTRPSVARVCVKIDVAKPVVQRIWDAVEGEQGFWQRIVVEDLLAYCSSYWRLGHSHEECKRNSFEFAARHQQNRIVRRQNQQVCVPVSNLVTVVAKETEAMQAAAGALVAAEGNQSVVSGVRAGADDAPKQQGSESRCCARDIVVAEMEGCCMGATCDANGPPAAYERVEGALERRQEEAAAARRGAPGEAASPRGTLFGCWA